MLNKKLLQELKMPVFLFCKGASKSCNSVIVQLEFQNSF